MLKLDLFKVSDRIKGKRWSVAHHQVTTPDSRQLMIELAANTSDRSLSDRPGSYNNSLLSFIHLDLLFQRTSTMSDEPPPADMTTENGNLGTYLSGE